MKLVRYRIEHDHDKNTYRPQCSSSGMNWAYIDCDRSKKCSFGFRWHPGYNHFNFNRGLYSITTGYNTEEEAKDVIKAYDEWLKESEKEKPKSNKTYIDVAV